MQLLQDIRCAVRFVLKTLRAEVVSTVVTVLTLAIAIAANTTIFAVANALLFKQTPGISQPARLVNLGRTIRGSGFD